MDVGLAQVLLVGVPVGFVAVPEGRVVVLVAMGGGAGRRRRDAGSSCMD